MRKQVWTRDNGSLAVVPIKAKLGCDAFLFTQQGQADLRETAKGRAEGRERAPFTYYKAPRKSGRVSGGYVQGSYSKLVNW